MGRIQRDLRFQRPERQSIIIPTARPIAVSEITHQMPLLPHRAAAQAASGILATVIVLEVNIGGSVSPAPPSAPSSTISAQTKSCETAATRRKFAPSAITAASALKIAAKHS